jgi:hypothetical protein
VLFSYFISWERAQVLIARLQQASRYRQCQKEITHMTADEYLKDILSYKKAEAITLDDWRLSSVKSTITNWAGQQLSELKQSGSSAKGLH